MLEIKTVEKGAELISVKVNGVEEKWVKSHFLT